jgi:arsenite methyltransferase
MAILEFSEEASQQLLAVYITPDIVEQRNKFLNELNIRSGERVLDVGSGPGFLVQAISYLVGELGSVCGVDVSEFLLDVARTQTKDQIGIEFVYGDATKLPYPNEDFDTVICTQVLEYLPDVDAALAEFHRVVRKGGRIALLDTDWDSIVWHSSNRVRMKGILTAWETHAADPFLPRTLAKRIERAGFQIEACKIIPLYNPQYDPDTYSNRMIDLIIPYVVEHGNISQEEAESWAHELRNCGKNGTYFFSLNRYFFLARKP